jgi:serum/glucocorticoid-regulated kinase 2
MGGGRTLGTLSADRLGPNDAEEIMKHPFCQSSMSAVLSLRFNGLTVSFTLSVDWKKLLAKQIQPPFKPNAKSAVDCSNIDEVFTSEEPVDSLVEGSKISQTVQNQFIYTNPHELAVSPHCATVS